MRISKEFRFESAHVLPHHPGKCSRLHGHSYRLQVVVEGPLELAGPAAGMVVDFDALGQLVRERVIDHLDHRYLNDLIENPTCELIVRWIWERLSPSLAGLDKLILWETADACAILDREDVSR